MSSLRNRVAPTTSRPTATRALRAGIALAAVTLAACSESTSAPAAPETSLRPEGPRLTVATTSVMTATLYPTYDNVYVSAEGHRITIPANSICKVGVSGYGPTFWDKACATATAPIVFTIKSTVDASGRPRIDIHPDVRFSPSKTVTASFVDAAAAAQFNALIAYCPALGGCVDEAKTDPSLRTYTDKLTGRVSRRLKHFSGYTVIVGFDGESSERFDRAAAAARASGYITTTGIDGDGESTAELPNR
jgi:hypothetical protein